jgi:hypothetical protein
MLKLNGLLIRRHGHARGIFKAGICIRAYRYTPIMLIIMKRLPVAMHVYQGVSVPRMQISNLMPSLILRAIPLLYKER